MLTHLSLFSGIGGLDLAAEWAGFTTVAQCENDAFCKEVLRKRFPGVPLTEDIHAMDGSKYKGITVVSGGFPCQPFSIAGVRKGNDDARFLFPEMLRVISESQPAWVVAENVANFVNMGLDDACNQIESQGYEVLPLVYPASLAGAKHLRRRCFIVAHAKSAGRQAWGGDPLRTFERQGERPTARPLVSDGVQRAIASSGRRNTNGLPRRLDRLRALGNAVVPQQAYPIFDFVARYYREA